MKKQSKVEYYMLNILHSEYRKIDIHILSVISI